MSQNYGHEWIDYSQKYYQIPIVEDGVYRITYNDLNSIGVPVSTIAPDQFQIFAKEREIPLEVTGSGDNSFDPGDEIWFYGVGNDAWLDSLIYDTVYAVHDFHYSLYNDTLIHFLTWNSSGNGKRFQQETDVNFSNYTPQNYFIKKAIRNYTNSYNQGNKISGLSYNKYVQGEGWFSNSANGASGSGHAFNIPISTPQVYSSGPVAKLYASSASNSNAAFTGQGNHHFQIVSNNSNIVLEDSIYTGYQLMKINVDLPISEMSNTTSISHQIINDQMANSDQQAIGLFEIDYPHNPHFENSNFLKFQVPTNFIESKSRFDITGFTSGNWNIWTLDSQPSKITAIENAGTLQFLIPDGSGGITSREVIAFENSHISPIPSIQAVNGNGDFTDFSSTLLNEPYFIITHSSLNNGATAYGNYRSSVTGGSHNVEIIDINELYLQFGGGIRKHILGLRRFLDASINLWNLNPQYVFILGKSIREANETSATAPGSRKDPQSYQLSLVPSFGYPSSDHLIVAGLNGNGVMPGIPIGRLAAQNNNDIQTYLNKVITFEQQQDPNSTYTLASKEWQKHILHFGGGSNAGEQGTFKGYLNNYKALIEDTLFGGTVDSYFKTTSQPINPVVSGQVNDRIENGVTLMTFFGHASADGFDQNVDDPLDWNNNGKYPLVIGNACYTGDIHQPSSSSTSEEWVMTDDLGAIGFLSTVKLGFAFSLNLFTSELYRNISHKMYGESIGRIIQSTIGVYQNYNTFDSQSYSSASMGMTLHADPAIKLNPHDKPEFVLDQSRVFITPNNIDLSVDTMNLHVIVTNIGRATNDLIQVNVTRSFPNNNGDSTYTKYMDGSNYLDTVVFRLPVYANIGIGINQFNIQVDLPSNTDEQYDETFNNELNYNYIIDIDGIVPAWPYDYAVVPYDTVTVKASTINPLAKSKTYRFEIDTTDLFNSPFKKFQLVTQHGGTLEVTWDNWLNANSGSSESLQLQDSTVLFWRVAKDSTTPTWFESSFQYISGKWGWGQDHFFQRKNNDFNGQIYNRQDRQTEYGDNYRKITCEVFGNGSNLYEWNGTLYKLNGEIQEYSLCGLAPSIHVAVIDPFSLEPWGCYGEEDGTGNLINSNRQYGNANNYPSCRSRVEKYFIYRQNNATQLQDLENLLLNEVPDSAYILVYSTLYGQFNNWQSLHPNLFNTFNTLGSDSLVPGHANVPFIMLAKKGDPSFTKEILGANIDEFIALNDTIFGVDFVGRETSTTVGPAFNWDKLYWQSYTDDPTPGDSVRIKLYGIQINNTKDLVLDTLLTFNDSLENLNNWAPPATYNRLQIEAYHHDSVHFTPRQLDSWHVLYDPVPEAAFIDAATLYKTFDDTLQEGEDISLAIDIGNISQFDMDSIKVDYWIEDEDRVRHNIDYPRQDSLRVGQILRDTITFNSRFYPGLNSLWIEVNPYINSYQKDQPEQYHFNNIAQIPFYSDVDRENPILDVTFDGQHILNGDIVSPSPEIFISLKDENPYLIMDDILDTANFDVVLINPEGQQKNIHFQGSPNYEIYFEPASENDKKFKIYFQPKQLDDGVYSLRVQGEDKSGNKSGDFYYTIDFEVINKTTITRLMNYPNPFSTQTRFVFTLTGSVLPDYMKIQIMTVTGKLVREITIDELGPIHIGRNITEYAWDGRDEFGDLLANGVYLYRVIAELNGEPIEIRTSGADQYFKKDFGKMVLFR